MHACEIDKVDNRVKCMYYKNLYNFMKTCLLNISFKKQNKKLDETYGSVLLYYQNEKPSFHIHIFKLL